MRKFVIVPALITLSLVSAGLGSAMQGAQQQQITPEQFFDLLREDLDTERVALVGAAMELTAEQAAGFWTIYNEYDADRQLLGDRRVELILDYASNYQTMTEDKARELVNEALSIQQARLELMRSYVERYDGELGPIVAARFMQVENQINNLIDLQVAAEVPLITGR